MAEDRIGKDRMLELYTRLAEGKPIYKAEEAEHYKCSLRSIQRDIEDLRKPIGDLLLILEAGC